MVVVVIGIAKCGKKGRCFLADGTLKFSWKSSSIVEHLIRCGDSFVSELITDRMGFLGREPFLQPLTRLRSMCFCCSSVANAADSALKRLGGTADWNDAAVTHWLFRLFLGDRTSKEQVPVHCSSVNLLKHLALFVFFFRFFCTQLGQCRLASVIDETSEPYTG